MIIGAFESPTFEQETVHLNPGDVIVAYTDGVIDAHSPQGEVFGEERFEQLALQHQNLSASEVIKTILQAIADFTRGAEQHDDITLVVMKVL